MSVKHWPILIMLFGSNLSWGSNNNLNITCRCECPSDTKALVKIDGFESFETILILSTASFCAGVLSNFAKWSLQKGYHYLKDKCFGGKTKGNTGRGIKDDNDEESETEIDDFRASPEFSRLGIRDNKDEGSEEEQDTFARVGQGSNARSANQQVAPFIPMQRFDKAQNMNGIDRSDSENNDE